MKEITRRGLIFGAATAAAYGLLVGVERVCLSAFADNTESEDDPGPVKIVKFADDGARLGVFTLAKVRKNQSEWKKLLTPLQYDVTRRAATEFAFSGTLYDQHAPGLYRCVDCGNALFDSKAKFDSGTGWPSFWEPIGRKRAREKRFQLGCAARGSEMHSLRRPFGACLHGRARADRFALLHEFRSSAVRFQATKRLAKTLTFPQSKNANTCPAPGSLLFHFC